ncbi:MAG: radical SAM family heme chaperone HemW [Bacteroidota bacterium]
MAGIYLHIPFCKQACHYCDFHFSTSLKYREEVLEAMLKELNLRKDYLQGAPLESIYFGGGTPSILGEAELNLLFEKIYELHDVKPDAEITLEANPDDLTEHKLQELKQTPVNRLSIGIQSFSEEDLVFMNRAHNAVEASRCIELAQAAGFYNLTIDLIYGSPTTSHEQWAENIARILDFNIPHISCYCLTVEAKTALAHFVETGKTKPVDDQQAAQQFQYLMDQLGSSGYDHYEISNFAKLGNYAVHNSNYWLGKSYLGIGPSAHSYNGESRQWNVANNSKYRKALSTGELDFEIEFLNPAQRYNEMVMTRLRTIWGVQSTDLAEPYRDYFIQQMQPFLAEAQVLESQGCYVLSPAGRLLADRIAMEAFWA